jgi:hypothetical protein
VRLGLLTEQELESAIATEFNPVRVGESWLIVPTYLLSVLVSHSSSNATPGQHAAALTFVKTSLLRALAAMVGGQRGKGSFSEGKGPSVRRTVGMNIFRNPPRGFTQHKAANDVRSPQCPMYDLHACCVV